MMILREPDELVGKKYDEETYHCWSFIEECLVVPTLHNIAVSRAEENVNDNMAYFIEMENPLNYCIVLLGKKHVGIYVSGNVYHNDIDAVKCQPLRALKRLYPSVKYFDKVM